MSRAPEASCKGQKSSGVQLKPSARKLCPFSSRPACTAIPPPKRAENALPALVPKPVRLRSAPAAARTGDRLQTQRQSVAARYLTPSVSHKRATRVMVGCDRQRRFTPRRSGICARCGAVRRDHIVAAATSCGLWSDRAPRTELSPHLNCPAVTPSVRGCLSIVSVNVSAVY